MNDFKGIIEDVEKSSLVSDKVIKRVIEIIGQEKWQDINDEKSDICTTTGELVITLKRIPDLEEEIGMLNSKVIELEQQIEKMKRHCNCKHRDSEGYCEVKRTYLMDLSYNGCDKWELEGDKRK